MAYNAVHPAGAEEPFGSTSTQLDGIKVRSRRPCDCCRRRKSRCEIVNGSPPCLLCVFHRQQCTFDEEPQPRKRRAVAVEDDHQQTSYPRRRSSLDTAQVAHSEANRGAKIRREPPIDDYVNLRGPTLLKQTLGLQRGKHGRFVGATSEYEQTLLDMSYGGAKTDIAIGGGTSRLTSVDAARTTFLLAPDNETRNHKDDIQDLDAIETIVAPHGPALIHLYFRIVHPSFPILHKEVWLEKYKRTHREFSPPCLAAVYLLALNWWSYSAELAPIAKPDEASLEELALKSMSNVIHRPKLSTIQAGLLLLQRPGGDTWTLTSQLVALGQDLGLHLDCTRWRIPAWERGLRKRLGWALFMQDKWGSTVHGRPSHLSAADWDVQPLNDDDFPENAKDEDDEDGSTEVEKGRDLFCEMIRLTEILSNILSNLFTLQFEREVSRRAHEGVRWILDVAKPLQLALREWHANLPPALRLEDLAARKLSSTGYLHLGYYAVEMTLHRRIIRSLSSADDSSLRTICRRAAQERLQSAVEFVAGLRPQQIQSFWYSASSYNFALIGTFIGLLWSTSTDKREADMHKKCLDDYRWSLRLCSKSAPLHERAVSMLAASTEVLVKSIPHTPDADLVLSRHLMRWGQDYHIAPERSQSTSYVSPTAYLSESELSPETALRGLPWDADTASEPWNVDVDWFAGLDATTDEAGNHHRGFSTSSMASGANGLQNDNSEYVVA